MIIPDCQECGACCSFGGQYVPITPEDLARFQRPDMVEDADPEQFKGYPFIPTLTMKARCLPDGSCVALEGKVGGPCRCSIYENRPEACSSFRRGSPGCIYLLGWHRLGRPW